MQTLNELSQRWPCTTSVAGRTGNLASKFSTRLLQCRQNALTDTSEPAYGMELDDVARNQHFQSCATTGSESHPLATTDVFASSEPFSNQLWPASLMPTSHFPLEATSNNSNGEFSWATVGTMPQLQGLAYPPVDDGQSQYFDESFEQV